MQVSRGCYLTELDVRAYVADNETKEGFPCDFDFTPEEMAHAMQSAAREWNSTPPYVSNAFPNQLSKHTNIFYDGCAAFLYLLLLQKEMRGDTPYTAGSVNVDIAARRVPHYREMYTLFYERFMQAARAKKKITNIEAFTGRVG